MRTKILLLAILIIIVSVSAISVVFVKHYKRTLFVEVQQLEKERDKMEVEWGQLKLEQNTWATHARIDKIAREKLHMHSPDNNDIIYIKMN
jgi:cell division protein FtsL